MNHALILATLLLAGCSMSNPIDRLKPYKLDIQQGNQVTQEMVSRLKPGMTPAQVRFVLGTPLIVDPFHADRWDYVLRVEKDGRLYASRHITVVFQDGKLKGVEGDVVASGNAAPSESREAK